MDCANPAIYVKSAFQGAWIKGFQETGYAQGAGIPHHSQPLRETWKYGRG